MNIQDLYMAVCIIDPIRDGEITRDRNFKPPPGIIVIRSIGTPHGFFSNRLDDVPERPAVPGRQPFKKFHDFDRNQQAVVHHQDSNLWSNSSNVTHLSGFLSSIFSDIRAR
jgi:hypothetical protein